MARMKRAIPVWAVLWALAALGAVPRASAQGDAQKQIQGIFDRFDRAYEARDSKAIRALMERYMTPDFTRKVGKEPPVPRSKMIARAGTDLRQLASVIDAATRVTKLAVNGNAADVLTRNVFVGTMKDPHGVTLRLSNAGIARYAFVRTPAGWKARRMVELSHEFRVNDRLIQAYPPAPKKR